MKPYYEVDNKLLNNNEYPDISKEILISKDVVNDWKQKCKKIVKTLYIKKIIDNKENIPNEKIIFYNNKPYIFCGNMYFNIAMEIKKDHYKLLN